MIIPNSLHPGDKICILSPASSIKHEYIDKAAEVINKIGFKAVISNHAKGISGTYSGSIDERLSDLREAFEDPEIKAIICSRGGYGIVHLIDNFPVEYLQKHAKWVIGFSDVTALHAMMTNAGIVSLHAPMCKHFALQGETDEYLTSLFSILQGNWPTYHIHSHAFNRPGKASGEIIGGNMAVMCALMGTKFNFLKRDIVLFIEDIGEEVYKIERMMYQLKLADILPNIRGLIVGHFTEYERDERNNEDMYDMISRMVKDYDYPVAFNVSIGHTDDNLPIIEGANVALSVENAATILQFIK